MADDTLRMPAVVTDGFTGPLTKLNSLLTQVGANPAIKNVAKDWGGVTTQINKVSTDLRSNLQPVLSGIGMASFGIAGAISAATGALKSFSFNTREMTLFSRQIGLSVDQLRQLKSIGERFGVDWNTTQGSLKAFAGNMDDLQRRWGEAYGKLRRWNLGDLAEDLFSARDMNTAIEKALDGIRRIQNPVRRREVAQLLFGTDQIAIVATETTAASRDAMRKMVATITPEMQQASEKFVSNWKDMETAVDGFVVNTLGPRLPQITNMVGELNKVLDTFRNKGAWEGLKALDQMSPQVLNPNAGIEMVGPGEASAHFKRQRAEKLQRQIATADSSIEQSEKLGLDTRAARTRRDELVDQLRRLTDELRALRGTGGAATISPMGFDGGGGGGMAGLIQRAAFGGFGGFNGGGVGNPFSAGFWGGVYRQGMGGDPFRGGGRTWDRSGGGGGGGGGASEGSGSVDGGRFTPSAHRPAEAAGKYRPEYKLSDADLDQRVINTIAGEARRGEGTDAVINNMLNRVGSKGWGPSANLLQVARAPGQYAGYRNASSAETDYIRSRIRAIASGGLPDNTGGSNSFRSESYYQGEGRSRTWARTSQIGPNVGGNRFAYAPGFPNGPYAPYGAPREDGGGSTGSRRADGPRNVAGWGSDREMQEATGVRRSGDSMMGRAFGAGGVAAGAMKMESTGSVSIHLSGGLEKAPARVTMDGLFKDVKVNRKVSMTDTGDGSP